MSTALRIASVTQVLKDLINNGFIDNNLTGITGGNINVTALAPDKIDTSISAEPTQLNIFMYQVTPNPGWSNVGFPSRDAKGDLVKAAPLVLDLHYLLTAYGAAELQAEILLGYGMQLLHENPVLPREAIRRSLVPPSNVASSGLPPHLQALATSGLADQIEQIKITPKTLSTEELSKLWTSFQAKFRPSSAYLVTAVLIESKKSTKSGLPVKTRNIYTVPIEHPVIQRIFSQSSPGEPVIDTQKIFTGYSLIIRGDNLAGGSVKVRINEVEIIPALTDMTASEIKITMPASLFAGIQGVQVVQEILMGDPQVLHTGSTSNIETFVLSPTITTVTITNLTGAGTAPRAGNINLVIAPFIRENQKVVIYLNEIVAPGVVPQSYSFTAPSRMTINPTPPVDSVIVPFTGIKAGSYLVRVQVDGAESPIFPPIKGVPFTPPQVIVP